MIFLLMVKHKGMRNVILDCNHNLSLLLLSQDDFLTRVRVANELGASNAKGAKFAITVSLFNSLAVGLLCWLIVIIFHEKLAMIFTSSIPVITMVNELSVMLAFTILFNCIQPVLLGRKLNNKYNFHNGELSVSC